MFQITNSDALKSTSENTKINLVQKIDPINKRPLKFSTKKGSNDPNQTLIMETTNEIKRPTQSLYQNSETPSRH